MPQYRSNSKRPGSSNRRPTDEPVTLAGDSDRPVLTPELARVLSSIVRRLHHESEERRAA